MEKFTKISFNLKKGLLCLGLLFNFSLNAQVLINDNFTTELPAGWVATDQTGSRTNWVFNNPSIRSLPSPFIGDFAIFDSYFFAIQMKKIPL